MNAAMKSLVRGIRTVAHGMGIDIVRHRERLPVEQQDPESVAIWDSVRDYTMTSPARVLALLDAVRYIVASGIPGDFLECGVWRGGSMMAAAMQLLKLGATDRELYLFDTFEGMPAPSEHDIDPEGKPAHDSFGHSGNDPVGGRLPWKPASVEEVRAAMLQTGYPPEKIKLFKGRTQETIPGGAPRLIALLRLDTDWYESTHHEMTHLYPRIVRGGVLVLDDYGYWKGSRKAVDEYLKKHDIRLLLCPVDSTARMAVVR